MVLLVFSLSFQASLNNKNSSHIQNSSLEVRTSWKMKVNQLKEVIGNQETEDFYLFFTPHFNDVL